MCVCEELRNTHLIVMNILECVADHTNPHVDQVRGGHLKYMLGKLFTVLVDLLQREKKEMMTKTICVIYLSINK